MPTHTGVAATVATGTNPALGTGTGTSPATAGVARGGPPRSLFKAHVTPGLAGGPWPEPEPVVVAGAADAGDGEQETVCRASSSSSASSCQATNHTTRASSGGPSAQPSQDQSQSNGQSHSNSQPTIRVGFASRYFTASQDVGAMVQGLLPLLARPYAPTTTTSTPTSTTADDAATDDHGDTAWRHGTVEIHTFLIGQPDGGVDLATATDPVLRRCVRPAAAPPSSVPHANHFSCVDLYHQYAHFSPLSIFTSPVFVTYFCCLGSLYAASTAVHQLPLDITVCSRALRHAAVDVLVYPEVHTYYSRHAEPIAPAPRCGHAAPTCAGHLTPCCLWLCLPVPFACDDGFRWASTPSRTTCPSHASHPPRYGTHTL